VLFFPASYRQTRPKSGIDVDGPGLENLLRKFLTDQTKSDENEIEELIKKLNNSYLNGDFSTLDDKATAKEKDKHFRVIAERPVAGK
jgi:hypothetical protein